MFLDSILNASNSYGSSSAYGYNQAVSKTFGTEASLADIQRANEANELNAAYLRAQQSYNSAEAQKNRDFQEYMSNTSYQRAVEDLRKAGLNPILAAMNAGASTPSGGAASSGLATATKANTYANSESRSKGENWSSSQQTSETQLKELIDGLGGIISGAFQAFGTAISGKNAAKQKTEDAIKNANEYQDFKGNNTSAKGYSNSFRASKPSDFKSKGKSYFKAEMLS